MKNIFLTTILMFSLLCGNAQVNDNSGIVFDTTVYQFGSLKEGSDAECVFTFINKNETPVVITNVKVFCGCVMPDWTKEPVKPNHSGTIKVKFHAGTTGTFSKTIYVFTNRNNKSLGLTVKGVVSSVSPKH
jgi:hypothetical protein